MDTGGESGGDQEDGTAIMAYQWQAQKDDYCGRPMSASCVSQIFSPFV
jgi:hypothetical protein